MCRLFSRDSRSPSTRTLPSYSLGPWVRELETSNLPHQQLDLPTSVLATIQPPSPTLVAGEEAEQRHGLPKCDTPHCKPLVALGEGQKTSCTLTPWPLPSALHHCAAQHLQPHRTGSTWTLQLLPGAMPAFWGAQPGWREFSWAWGQQLVVLALPRCPHSHSSVPASPAASRCSRIPCRTLWCRAGSGLFLHSPSPIPALNPAWKADNSPGFHRDRCLGARTHTRHGAARTAACSFIPSTGVRWATAGEMFPLSLSQAPGHKLPLTQLFHPVSLPGEMPP